MVRRTAPIYGSASELSYDATDDVEEGSVLWLPARNSPDTHFPQIGIDGIDPFHVSPEQEALLKSGFMQIPHTRFNVCKVLREHFAVAQESFNHLVRDPFQEANNPVQRNRAFSTFEFIGDELYLLEHQGYQPEFTGEQNQYYNGKLRKFPAMDKELVTTNLFLRSWLRSIIYMTSEEFRMWPLRIKLNQIRTFAMEGDDGSPTPEGLHLDGESYIFVLLVYKTADGGQPAIHCFSTEEFIDFVQTLNPLDMYAILEGKKPRVKHRVSDISYNPMLARNGICIRDVYIANIGQSPEAEILLNTRIGAEILFHEGELSHDAHVQRRIREHPSLGRNIVVPRRTSAIYDPRLVSTGAIQGMNL